jgi:hypothetical protein
VAQRRKYLWPAFASAIVAGLGQVIKGDALKGLKIMLWIYLGFPMIIFGSLLLNAYLFLACLAVFVIAYPVLWVLNIMDAYSAQTGPAYRPAQRRSGRARRRA